MATPTRPRPADQLPAPVVQLVRTAVQGLWALVLNETAVGEFLDWAGIDGAVVESVFFLAALAAVVAAGRALGKVHPFFGWLLNGINRPPAYPDAIPVRSRRVR